MNAKSNEIARETDTIIRDWLHQNKLSNDSVFDAYIDSCELGTDPEWFIKRLENDEFDHRIDKEYED